MVHIRCNFHEARDHHPQAAEYALGELGKCYAFERKYKEEGISAEEIKQRRKEEVQPIFDSFLEWVENQRKNNLSKGTIGIALNYAANQLPNLRRPQKETFYLVVLMKQHRGWP